MHSHHAAPHRLWPGLLAFTAAYMLLACFEAWRQQNAEFIFYIVFMLLLLGVVWGVHRRLGLSRGLLWCLSIWGLLHMAGGLLVIPESWPYQAPNPVLYSLWLIPDGFKYDQLVHAFGFGSTTWLCWQLLCRMVSPEKPLRPTTGLMILMVAAGTGFGALNEVVEFIVTLIVPETNVGGYENTAWDLVFNLIGSMIAAVLIRLGVLRHH